MKRYKNYSGILKGMFINRTSAAKFCQRGKSSKPYSAKIQPIFA